MVKEKVESASSLHKVGRKKEVWYVLECPNCGDRSYVASPSIEGWCNKLFGCKGNKMKMLGQELKSGRVKKIV